jgi:ATP-dependent helicase HepA
MSETEPELGLGTVIKTDGRYVEIVFETKKTSRRYSLAQASLKRILFKEGDRVHDKKGAAFIITSVCERESGGPVIYQCGTETLNEEELADTVNVSTPLQKLVAGVVSPIDDFYVRDSARTFKAAVLGSPLRGFVGGRIELLAHQMNIAETLSSRKTVRGLLADETGLGKTIESCLIAHRLMTTGRVSRVLVLVPEHLVNQWFVELYRKFNRTFTIFSGDDFIDRGEGDNPFLTDVTGICDINLLSNSREVGALALAAPWDLVIVDEAHHLREGTAAFAVVKGLSERSPGFLMLTATPEQLGRESHFARLQLLDRHRYTRFSDYESEMNALRFVGNLVKKALRADQGGASDIRELDSIVIDVPDALQGPPGNNRNKALASRPMTIDRLIDVYGIGRTMFRNTRQAIAGFPKRLVRLVPLAASPDVCARIQGEFESGPASPENAAISLSDDPRIPWLVGLLKGDDHHKILVICSTQNLAIAVSQACLKLVKTDIALFHESMTIIQRDRNAAWFAEENGARALVCSEIGSEGRNFQFCQCLVLFDLPPTPELVEQRIGRLDRIGQKSSIFIYVPFVPGTAQETLCRWYHEGLDAFNRNVPAAGMVFEAMYSRLLEALEGSKGPFDTLLADARKMRDDLMERHLAARDQLFDVVSFQPARSRAMVEAIATIDGDTALKDLMERLFKHYGIALEDAGKNKFALLTDYVTDNGFPLPRSERPIITYDRSTALSREDVEFITIDHPMVISALDLTLSSGRGDSSFVVWDDPSAREILLETFFVVECIAPAKLIADRFLPPSAVRCVIGHTGRDVTNDFSGELLRKRCVNGNQKLLAALCKSYNAVIVRMFETSKVSAHAAMVPKINGAIETMHKVYDREIERMEFLQLHKGLSAKTEIQGLVDDKKDLQKYLNESTLRLDSVRLIYHGPNDVF